MNKAKPVEAGCRAIITACANHPEVIWTAVRVIRKLPRGDYGNSSGHRGFVNNGWLTDVKIQDNGFYEHHLMRIDDPDIQDQIEDEEAEFPITRKRERVYAESMKRVRQKTTSGQNIHRPS